MVKLFFYIFLAIALYVLVATLAYSAQHTFTWIVPEGVTLIKVTSVKEGDTILEKTFAVEPGQSFTFEAVE
jgi:hypothetical protein